MSRYSLPAIGLSSLLLATQVGALELGNIRVLSAEDEPFNADIELSDVGQLKPMDIAIALASEVEFQQARIERHPFLDQLTYDVILNGRDGGVIHVSGPVAIPDDEWQILLEARWPNGRRLKSFMVETDQQSFVESGEPIAVPDQAVTEYQEEAKEPEELIFEESELPLPGDEASEPLVARPEPVIAADEPAELVYEDDASIDDGADEQPTAIDVPAPIQVDERGQDSYEQPVYSSQGETYTTERGDVLWRIAQQVRPSDDVNIYQTLLALQQANPSAFVRNNVNRLKVGQVLRIPSADEVRANGRAHAQQEIAEQIRVWEEEKGIVRQLDARPSAQEDRPFSSDTAPTLSLSTSDGSSTQSSDPDNANVEQITSQLEAALSQLQAAQQNSAALSEELQAKNETVTELRNKLAVLNEQLASLQSKLTSDEDFTELKSELDDASQAADDQDIADNEQLAESDASADIEPAINADADDEALEFEPAEDPESEFEEVTSELSSEVAVPDETAHEPGIVEQLKSWKGLALIGGLIAAIGLFFFARRGRDEEEYVEENFDLPEERLVPPPEEQQFSETDNVDSMTSDVVGTDNDEVNVASDEVLDDTDEDEEENNDPLKEADIYLAYGRHPEAADLLEKAIDEDPENIDLLQKLVDVHTASGDEDAARQVLDRMVEVQSDEFVEPATEHDLEVFEDLADLDSEIGVQGDGELPELEDISDLNTVIGDDSVSAPGEAVDDILADLELDLGDDDSDVRGVSDASTSTMMDLEDLQIPDELAADNDDYEDEFEAIAELDNNVVSLPEEDSSLFETTFDDEGLPSADQSFADEQETTEHVESEEEVLERYEISLQSADQLISEGRPAAAKIILESMMSSGTALQKQQAKEMLLGLD